MQRRFKSHINRHLTVCTAAILAGLVLFAFKPDSARAQGTAQVVLTGIPPILPSPYISDLERSYQQGLFTTQFIFVSPSRQPQSFRFRLTLEVNGELLIDMTSEPNSYAPGIHVYRTFDDEPAIDFPLDYADLIDLLNANVEQTGVLPEGDYVLSVEPVVEDEFALIPTVPGMTFFSVRYAEPPLLLTPFDQSNLTTQFPVFSWTPVSGAPLTSTFEYELALVEVFPGQAPYQALESNIALVREVLVGQTSFVYTLEELPLEEGKLYAWQVHARDVNEQMPLLDRGETEFYTFSVGQEGLGSMLTSWSFPVNSPFLIYEFEKDADIDPADTEIFIDGVLPVELIGVRSEASFEKLLIDSETQTIIEGQLTISAPLALEVAINTLSDALSGYTAVPAGSAPTLSDGMILELGDNVRIDAAGLHPRGTQKAVVSYTGLPTSEWTATYSNNFSFGFAPFSITRGRVDFAAEGVAQAYADASGFHVIDQGDPVIAQIPDRLQLPDDDVAFISLKRSGMLLVDTEPGANGQFIVSEKAGVELELTLPGLNRRPGSDNQRYVASLQDVVIDAKTGQLVSGKVTATAAGKDSEYTLDALGIPIAPTSFSTRNTADGIQLDIEGPLTILGIPVQNADPVRLTMNEAGVVEGSVSIGEEGGFIYLDGESGQVSIEIAGATGTIRAPLNAYVPGDIDIEVRGSFNINRGDDRVAAADIRFAYTGEGPVVLQHFSPAGTDGSDHTISLDGYGLQIDEISSLSLFYTFRSGLNYVAGLETHLSPISGSPHRLPLSGVELHQNRFYFPAQEAHEGTDGFVPFTHEASAASLELLAYRIPGGTVARKRENSAPPFSPRFDFEVHLDGFQNLSNRLAALPLTLQDASIEDGIIEGEILPYSIEDPDLSFPLETGLFHAQTISGSLSDADSAQDLSIEMQGNLRLATAIADAGADCQIPGVSLTLHASGEMTGSSEPFRPCTPFSIGPVAAMFSEARLQVASDSAGVHYAMAGNLEAFSRPASNGSFTASGPLKLDVISGRVLEADVEAARLFWEFPVASPSFQINAEDVHLSEAGFLIESDSSVSIIDIASNTAYLLKPRGPFRLGLKPALTNSGTADLVPVSEPETRVAFFDANGFHYEGEEIADLGSFLPRRIVLPGGSGAYIDVAQSGTDAFTTGAGASGRSIKTRDNRTAVLVLPQLSTPGRRFELPVSFEVTLNQALEYAGGTIDHDLSARPINVLAGNSPMRVTRVRYDESSARILLTGVVDAPEYLQGGQSDLTFETTLELNAAGLASADLQSASFSLYGGTLVLHVDVVDVRRETSALAVQLSGRIDSPLLNHASVSSPPLPFTTRYDASSEAWQIAASAPESRWIAVDQASLQLDPRNPPQLTADPDPVLQIAGLLSMPGIIGQDFAVEVEIEIGAGGVYVWHSGNIDRPQPLFGGFLMTHLDAVDIRYDAGKRALVATIDGAFAVPIVAPSEEVFGYEETSDLLPFAGLELATNGDVAIGTNLNTFGNASDSTAGGSTAIRLLQNLPRMPVISESFWIEDLVLRTPGKGLYLEFDGAVRIPTPENERMPAGQALNGENASIVFSDRVPVTFVMDALGNASDENGDPWRPDLIEPGPSTGRPNRGSGFEITSAYLHFDPRQRMENSIFSTARVYAPAGQSIAAGDSTVQTASEEQYIALGDPFNTKHRPGLIITQNRPRQYLVSDVTTESRPALSLENPFFDTHIRSITLPEPDVLRFSLTGTGSLKLPGLQGFFPIADVILTPSGLQDFGRSAGPSAFTFRNAGVFEMGCMDLGFAADPASPVGRLTRVQSGSICGDSLSLTLTDRYLSGSYGNLVLQTDGAAPLSGLITNAQIDLAGLASLTTNLSYNASSSPSFLIDGTTTFRGVRLESEGAIRDMNGRPSISVLFDPSIEQLSLLGESVKGTVAGGGFFINPDEADLELVDLVLDERSNNRFSSNDPASNGRQRDLIDGRPGLLLPLEIRFFGIDDSLDVQGEGLMAADNQFTTLDIDGAFLNRHDELSTGLFAVERRRADSTRSFEGLADISLNYGSTAGGIARTNFYASASPGGPLDWSVFGRSDIQVADTDWLPGQLMITRDGLLLDLYDTANITSGQLSVHNDFNLTLWSNLDHSDLKGYSAFDVEYDLIPGFSLSTFKMQGGFIEDREEHLFYAARNIFADVPFVYTGPIDPWLSLQDGAVYGGDARNTTFRRMITDARQMGARVPEQAASAIAALGKALDVQAAFAANFPRSLNLPYFANADSMLSEMGSSLLSLESAFVDRDNLPGILETLVSGLYNDPERPDYRHNLNAAAPTMKTLAALLSMNAGIAQSRRSAESDIFTLNGLQPRPLLWNADYVDLASELANSPVNSISWPGGGREATPGFVIDSSLVSVQRSSLLNFKQNNETLDVQFLRTIGGLELNLVNLKIARSPKQAVDFASATSNIAKYYASHIAGDWELLRWSRARLAWLETQEDAVVRGIRDNLRTYENLDNSLEAIRSTTAQRHERVRLLAENTGWRREDIPEDQRFAQHLESLDETSLKREFEQTAKNLWFDVPQAALMALRDTLASLIDVGNERFEAGKDSLDKSYGAFSLALDPLYDIQTRFTTTLYGMAEEYRDWRTSIRRLDPEAVNYAFQFLPYRGNYRILAEDLIPPVIQDIRISPQRDGFLNNTTITWTAEHPVDLSDRSIALSLDDATAPHFASLANASEYEFFTVKPDEATTSRDVNVTLRVRGAGGIPAVKKGHFTVSVDPSSEVEATAPDTPLVPTDATPPPKPQISNLSYSSYFSETPNTLKFELGPLHDEESGISRIEYRILNDRDQEEVLQDWTLLQISTAYFSGRLIETGLPVQEEDVTVRVIVRAANEAGLSSESSQTLRLQLDHSGPIASISSTTYYNPYDISHPHMLELALGEIEDEESGIDLIEYALQRGAQASPANAVWHQLRAFPRRNARAGLTSVFIDLKDEDLPENRTLLTLYLRVTNGAGLQTIVNRTIDIPESDGTPPTEPVVAIEHSGFYDPGDGNQLRIIVGGSQDLESGISSVEYRLIDGKTGTEIQGWDDFIFLDRDSPTFILPATEKVISLPTFTSSRAIIVETRATNAAGLLSNRGVRFIQLNLDDTEPTQPSLHVSKTSAGEATDTHAVLIELGPSQDPESWIRQISYRFVNQATQQALSEWQTLVDMARPVARFPGITTQIDVSRAVAPTAGEVSSIQVRVMNQQGLYTIVSQDLDLFSDATPPVRPALVLERPAAEGPGGNDALNIHIGPSRDPESGIASVRYRVRELARSDSSVSWKNVDVQPASGMFEGSTIRTSVPALNEAGGYLVDVEIYNGAGLSSRVSGVADGETQRTYAEQRPAAPEVNLFYFGSDNTIRKNEIEVRVARDLTLYTEVDSVRYRLLVFDGNGDEIANGNRPSWRSIPYRTARPDLPLTTYLPLPAGPDLGSARIDIRLVNRNGASPERRTYLDFAAISDDSPPATPVLDFTYTGYHAGERANQLYLMVHGIEDPETRIAQAAYRIVSDQNPNDVIIDWSGLSTIDDAGLFEPALISLPLPAFSRNRLLRIETRAINGAGLSSERDTTFAVTIDQSAPEIDEIELQVAGINDIDEEESLNVYLGALTDEESRIAAASYRVFAGNDSTVLLADWTPLTFARSHFVRFPAVSLPLPAQRAGRSITFELEVQNEAGLSATFSESVDANRDESPPQMPRVDLSFHESGLGTDYLLIEPGAFRDAESNIAGLEYRLIDNGNPDFVLLDWISIPVPHELRVSVAPIAVPRSSIPYDGAINLAVEFRATNGAGLSGVRRAAIQLPGDVSPPEPPSLIVAYRNAYDPSNPNAVEIQIGASEDRESHVTQARYRITNALSGAEVTAWTPLPVAPEGYFPGTILFEELPLIQNGTSLDVEVEIANSAGLIRSVTQNVRVDIENDATPPTVDISLYYISDEIALVLDHLSDPESKIRQVEYRFLDNVDQTELLKWTDLFEIAIPRDRYPKQSLNVQQPAVRSGRTLKIEVRVTNGAGLQTVVSRTVPIRTNVSGQ